MDLLDSDETCIHWQTLLHSEFLKNGVIGTCLVFGHKYTTLQNFILKKYTRYKFVEIIFMFKCPSVQTQVQQPKLTEELRSYRLLSNVKEE